ncbi:MAG: MFS transporter [Desulfuromonadales bacterium]
MPAMPMILVATLLTFSAMYVPQPLLPVLTAEFSVTREMAALLTTIIFIPLSLAPLAYGYLLEAIPAKRILRVSLLLLGLSSLALAGVESYRWMLALRLFQGLLFPALLTGLMTYTSQAVAPANMQRAMSWYIGATIAGGFAGRALSGAIASLYHWRGSFLLLGVSLLAVWIWMSRLPATGPVHLQRPQLGLIRVILSQSVYRRAYLMVFCFFLVFAAVMNFLPFRLTELTPQADELRIGLAYSGYLMGLLASLNAVTLQRWCGGVERTMVIGLLVYLLALVLLGLPSVALLLAVIFIFCGALFLTHATATGLVNRLAREHKGMVNGLYVAFYYGGGAIGSFLPGYVYRRFDWTGFIVALSAVVGIALLLAISLLRSRHGATEPF